MTTVRRPRIVFAVLLASGLHLALAIGLFWPADNTGAANVGVGGIEVAFGSAGGAPGHATLVQPDAASDDAPRDPLSEVQPVRTALSETPVAEALDPSAINQSEPDVTAPVKPDTADIADPTDAPRTVAELRDLTPPETPVEEVSPVVNATRPDVAEEEWLEPDMAESPPEAIDAAEPEPADQAQVAEASPAEPVIPETGITFPELGTVEAPEKQPDLEAVKGPPPEALLETVSVTEVERVGLTLAEDVKLTAEPPHEAARVDPSKTEDNEPSPAITRADPTKVEDTKPPEPTSERVRPFETVTRPINVSETVRRPPKKPAIPVRAPAPTMVEAPVLETNPVQPVRPAEAIQTVGEVTPKTAAAQAQPPGETVVAALPASGVAQAVAVPPGTGSFGDTGEGPKTGQADQQSTGGNPGARVDYLAQLTAILTQHKRYPRWAQARQQEGIGELYFVVAETGEVLSFRLHKSSGYRRLDKEILSILERVGKLPPIPPSIGTSQLELIVPINFSLR